MQNTIRLRKGEFLRLGAGGGRVVSGRAWATVANDSEDYILQAGQPLPCCFESLLVEALSEELIVENFGISSRIVA